MKGKPVFIYGLIILVVLSRLIPHPVNFTPIGALGLFAGAYIVDRRVWLLPICALLVSDIFVGFYEPVAMIFVYIGFALSVFIGRLVLSKNARYSDLVVQLLLQQHYSSLCQISELG